MSNQSANGAFKNKFAVSLPLQATTNEDQTYNPHHGDRNSVPKDHQQKKVAMCFHLYLLRTVLQSSPWGS
jgi:hypothetical protein